MDRWRKVQGHCERQAGASTARERASVHTPPYKEVPARSPWVLRTETDCDQETTSRWVKHWQPCSRMLTEWQPQRCWRSAWPTLQVCLRASECNDMQEAPLAYGAPATAYATRYREPGLRGTGPHRSRPDRYSLREMRVSTVWETNTFSSPAYHDPELPPPPPAPHPHQQLACHTLPEVDGVAGGATVRVLVDMTLAATGLVDGDSDGTAVDVGLCNHRHIAHQA
jgi:hypothetical protein